MPKKTRTDDDGFVLTKTQDRIDDNAVTTLPISDDYDNCPGSVWRRKTRLTMATKGEHFFTAVNYVTQKGPEEHA